MNVGSDASLVQPATGWANRLPALDGLRGIALAVVLGYHLRLQGFDAGFLGVDLFFVLSGFIITSRLLEEYRDRGFIDLRSFYMRRLWRLYPALVVVLLICLPLTAALANDALHRLILDTPAAFLYLSNWWQVWSSQSYFESLGREPVLRHLWSLAVEQHYYLVWPALMVVLLQVVGHKALGALAAVLALASTVAMSLLYTEDPRAANFVYLGTHTHAMGLFVGSALGCAAEVTKWRRGGSPIPRRLAPWFARGLNAAGFASLLGFGSLVLLWNESVPWLFHGGFLLASTLGALMIAATLLGQGVLGRLLSVGPLCWLGTRSYSIYLWHWPLCVWIFDGPGDLDPSGSRAAMIFVLSAVLGELSYRYIELQSRITVRVLSQRFIPWLNGASLWACAGALIFALRMLLEPQPDPASRAGDKPVQQGEVETATAYAARQVAIDAHPTGRTIFKGNEPVFIFGDSVVLGAKPYLARSLPGARIDAEVGRQMSELPGLIDLMRQVSKECPAVVIHLGTNGYIFEPHLRRVLDKLKDCKRVVLVDVYAARRWTEQNNELITRVAEDFSNVTILKWNALGSTEPQFFVQDGIHLSGPGISAFTREIALALGRTPEVVPVVDRTPKLARPAKQTVQQPSLTVATDSPEAPHRSETPALPAPEVPESPGAVVDD